MFFTYLQEAKEHRLLLLNQKRRNLPIPVDSVGAVLPVAVASGQSLLDFVSEYGQDSESEAPSSPHPNSEEPEQSQQTPAEPWFYAADEKERELTAVTVHARQLRRQVGERLGGGPQLPGIPPPNRSRCGAGTVFRAFRRVQG